MCVYVCVCVGGGGRRLRGEVRNREFERSRKEMSSLSQFTEKLQVRACLAYIYH